jgi:UDP-glucose 4-epimerase
MLMVGRRGDVPDLTADPARAERELGFTAPRELDEMCRDLWNWQRRNPEGYDTPEPAPAPGTPGAAQAQVTEVKRLKDEL